VNVSEADVIERLVGWAETDPAIDALILTSSRARTDETVDALSDYDVIIAVEDAEAFARDAEWTRAYGRPVARWGDEHEVHGLTTYFRGVVYEDGVKIDWTIWPYGLVARVAEADALPEDLDVGYRVLVDKDERTSGWKPATYRAHIPSPPPAAEYGALVEEFWWSSTYVAKSLWRDELIVAKFALDHDMKLGVLRRFLEWRIELDHDWSVRPGVLGRRLKRLLPAELWSEFERTYVGPGLEENWEALFRTTALFRRVAIEIGEELGHPYPQHVDERMTAYLHAVRGLPQG
jgi:aminoglycoside 6-adenylyltransferase